MINPQAVVPMVIETTGRGERAFDIYSLLLKNRIILVSTPINDQTASVIVAQLIYLSNEDPEAPIQMYISSPGGVVYSGLGIYDTMKMIPNQISTVAVGFTASFGTVLLTAGSQGHRYSPSPTQPSTCTNRWVAHRGRPPISRSKPMRSSASKSGSTNFWLKTPAKTLKRSKTTPIAMSTWMPEQAVEYGLVDHVLEAPEQQS